MNLGRNAWKPEQDGEQEGGARQSQHEHVSFQNYPKDLAIITERALYGHKYGSYKIPTLDDPRVPCCDIAGQAP